MKQQIGLVMEGGAMRGMFTAGVTDVFLENGIRADGAIGISAGATFGCNYVTGQKGRALRYCIRFARDPRFCSYYSLLTTGDMFGAEFCYHTIPELLDPIDNETFVKSGIPFYVAATDLQTGRAVYHLCRDIISPDELEWVRASASMPLASQIVHAGKYQLLDGGVADSIPLKYMEYKGYRRNIVILTQPAGYQKQPNAMMPLVRHIYWNYPAFIRAMERRHIMYNRQLEYVAAAEAAGTAFVIRPPQALQISHTTHSAERLRAVYAVGRETALRLLPALRAFLDAR